MIITFVATLNILILIILGWLVIKLQKDIILLKSRIDIILGEYTTFVKALGVAEGTVEGIASQEAKQEKIDKGLVESGGAQEITGIVTGTIKPVSK